ncbi:MAG: hypothetical protein ACI9B7_000410 [Oleispira sp.]|jgi:hypothetical protein
MADPKYDIYFRGEILPEADEAEVRAAIAKIFKADNAKLAQLFSGKVSTVKKSVDKATAAKYQQAFKKAGAKVVITIAKVTAESSVVAPEAVKPQVIEGSWDVLPTGNDLLKPDERRNIPDVDIDTSAIKMVSPFAKVDVDEKIDLPAPDTSHFSVADVGEDMNPNRIAPLPDLELDLSEFSVAEVGALLADKKHKNVPPAPDTKHIKLV